MPDARGKTANHAAANLATYTIATRQSRARNKPPLSSPDAIAAQVLLDLAGRHIATLMPAYTHTQPAQPITFGHYLMAVVELMGRDERRLQAAYATVNRCPLGACAISTTGGYNLEGYAPELEMPKGAQLVDGPVEARKAARD